MDPKIISGSDDKTIRVWDVSTDVEMLPPFQGHDGMHIIKVFKWIDATDGTVEEVPHAFLAAYAVSSLKMTHL